MAAPTFLLFELAILVGVLAVEDWSSSADWSAVLARAAGRLIVGWSLVLAAMTLLQSSLMKRSRWRAARYSPEDLLAVVHYWPGFRKSAGGVCLLLVLLTCFFWVVQSASGAAWGRWDLVWIALSAAAASISAFSLAGRRWSANLAEAGMGLMTLAVATLALLMVPTTVVEAAERFPMVFNAFVVGLALMAGFWVWIGKLWEDQLDGGEAWTAAGRISLLSSGFAFFVAAIGLINATLLAVWPRMASLSAADDSLGRFAAGIAGHLLLVLVLVRNGRNPGRRAHHGLAVLAVASMVVFVLVRADPFASRVY